MFIRHARTTFPINRRIARVLRVENRFCIRMLKNVIVRKITAATSNSILYNIVILILSTINVFFSNALFLLDPIRGA